MKIIVTPDSFKGSISARSLCSAIKQGIHEVYPDAIVHEIPLADGGEGTVENIIFATNGTIHEVHVKDPLGRTTKAAYGILGDGQTAIIEMAQASGLPLLAHHEKNPLITTSFGTGELIMHALDSGYRKFIVGIGGSATNDGGMGMLKALGIRFYNQDGIQLDEGGAALSDLAYFDDTNLDPRIKESSFMVASDVNNPLCGSNGASAIFGPQKGATPEMVESLDKALFNYGEVIAAQTGKDIRDFPGSGAAGGMGAALISFLQAQLRPGIDIMLEAVHFEDVIKDADLIITGEGRLDSQTLSGKVIAGVCSHAKRFNVPTIALCGGMELTSKQCDELGLAAGFSVVGGPCTLQEAMDNAANWTRERTEQIMRLTNIYQNKSIN
ncbi:glycerate kinase [Peribacillus deserti]|uniref:Glycerate kinase n=1 Tax=Peribacillus deserti TaxID=673318 RepID=A0ABS2QEH5_9BACI|nr:glycerate kinase [Peribacillus deserti]MBM7691528.1 glycerate kinase [Peribacillus deserti]